MRANIFVGTYTMHLNLKNNDTRIIFAICESQYFHHFYVWVRTNLPTTACNDAVAIMI